MADLDLISIKLKNDLKSIGLPVDEVSIEFATKYCKTYYALYYPKSDKCPIPRIRIYPYRRKGCGLIYPYMELLDTAIHEMCHHLQFREPNYVRFKGVVHDPNFWELYNKYKNRAETTGLLRGDEDEE